MRSLVVLGFGSLLAVAAVAAEISQVQSVYLLPMGNGLDQFLANRLTNRQVFLVVTDPQKADALLTDQIGASFEKRLVELYPPPPPPPPPETKKTEPPPKAEPAATEEPKQKEEPMVRFSTFGRGKGNVFLVDRKSGRVLWSVYERPRRFTADELDRTAERIVEQLLKQRGK